jgi:hypothetical protein
MRTAIAAVLVTIALAPACASVDDTPPPPANQGAGGDDAAADAPVETTPDVASEPTPEEEAGCDPSQCPSLGGVAQGCCKTDGTCGYDGAQLGLGCVSLSDILDGGIEAGDAGPSSCPPATVGGFTVQGCCLGTGFCGYFAPFVNTCVDPGSLPVKIPDAGPPIPCGPNADAGADATGDGAVESDAPDDATDAGDGSTDAADEAADAADEG